METREARIKVIIDTAQAARTGGGAASAVPGIPDAPSTSPAIPAATGQAAAPFGASWNVYTPPPGSPGGIAAPPGSLPTHPAPSAPASAAPAPVAPSVIPGTGMAGVTNLAGGPGTGGAGGATAGTLASAAARNRAATGGWNGWKAARNLGEATVGGSLSGAIVQQARPIPGVGNALEFSYASARNVQRYGPIVTGLLRGATEEATDDGYGALAGVFEKMVNGVSSGFIAATSTLDAVGSAIDPVLDLARSQRMLAKGPASEEQQDAQRKVIGDVFRAEYRIAKREAQMQAARQRIGMQAAGEQLGGLMADAAGDALRTMMREALSLGGAHR